jgi:hypothetical protein
MARETRHKENESIWKLAIPTINAEENMIRSATNNSWAYSDCFWVRVLMDVNKITYIMQRMRIPIANNIRK